MRGLIIPELLLSLWCASLCTAQEPAGQSLPPVGQIINIGSLSPDNPQHKQILSWIDNYRQRSADIVYPQSNDQSKQDSVGPNFSSTNFAIRQPSNQPQSGSAENPGLPTGYFEDLMKSTPQGEKPIQLDTSSLGQVFTPYAFASNPSGNGQSGSGSGDRILVQNQEMALRLFDQNQKRVEKLDPVVQDHIRKLQEQSLSDGRAVFVDVKGDNIHDDSSLLEKLRPMLYDPSVLDGMKAQLRESQNHQQNYQQTHPQNSVLFQRPTLQFDRPLLEQREKIEELRHALNNPTRIESNGQRLTPEEEKQIQLGQFNPQLFNIHNFNQQPIQQNGQTPVTPIATDKNQLFRQLDALALQPLRTQNAVPQPAPQPIIPQPLNLGAPDQSAQNYHQSQNNNINDQQAILLGQRPRQQPQFSSQPLTFNWQNSGHVQTENPENHNVAKRQEGEEWRSQDNNKWDFTDPDPQKQRLLREELSKHLEEQERKRQELMEYDLKQREMIAEERIKQEERDRQEAERRALLKELQKKKQLNKAQRQEQPQWQPKEQQWQKQDQAWPKQDQPQQRQDQPQWQPKQEQSWQPKLDQSWPKQEQAWPKQEQSQPRQDQQWQPKQEPQWQKQQTTNWQPVTPIPSPLPIPSPFTVPTPQHNTRQVSDQRWNSQEETIPSRSNNNPINSGRPIDVMQTTQTQSKPQTQSQLPPRLPAITNWPSNNAIAQINNNEKKAVEQRSNGPIFVSAAALAQAEQSDAEYVRMLREILLGQNNKDIQLSPETRFIAIDPQSIGSAHTAQSAPQPTDNGQSEWWKAGDGSPRVASFESRHTEEGSKS